VSNPTLLCFLILTAALSTIFYALIIVAGLIWLCAGGFFPDPNALAAISGKRRTRGTI
jgi:hypothetical protein